MARAIAAVGMAITVITTSAVGVNAQSNDDEVAAAATEAGVDQQDLRGAMASTQRGPYDYLRGVGELPSPYNDHPTPQTVTNPYPPAVSARANCIIRVESRGDANAQNARTGAAGLGQFLLSTWMTTPQGRAGLSRFDPTANRAAVQYMLNAGRAREFVAVSGGYC